MESPVKRGLQGLSVVTVLVFGGIALFHVSQALGIAADRREWRQTNGAWTASKCEAQLPADVPTRLICQEAWGRKAYFDSAPRREMTQAAWSLAIALAAPMLLLLWNLRLRFARRR